MGIFHTLPFCVSEVSVRVSVVYRINHEHEAVLNLGAPPRPPPPIQVGQLAVEMFLMQLDGDERAKLASLTPKHSGEIDVKIEGPK